MSIEEHGVVDFVRVDKASGKVVLSITDHLDWSNINEHLWQLQEKVNAYVSFIESGEILEKYPEAMDREVVIELAGVEQLPKEAEQFLEKSNLALKNVPTQITFRLFEGM